MRKLVISMIVLIFGAAFAYAQTGFETFTSDDGLFTIEYPVGWHVDGSRCNCTQSYETWFTTNKNLLPFDFAGVLESGQIAIGMFIILRGENDFEHFTNQFFEQFPDGQNRVIFPGGRVGRLLSTADSAFATQQSVVWLPMILDQSHMAVVYGYGSPKEADILETHVIEMATSLQYAGTLAPQPGESFVSTFDRDPAAPLNWPVGASDYKASVTLDGLYRVSIPHPNQTVFITLADAATYTDATVSMTVRNVDGSMDDIRSYGIMFRMDRGDSYLFEVYNDGHYAVWEQDFAVWSSIMPPVPGDFGRLVIDQTRDTNTLTVTMEGDTFTVAFNDDNLIQTVDSSYGSGTVGIYVVAAPVIDEAAEFFVDSFSVDVLDD